MDISRELFDQQRLPRSGTQNPERMQLAFWEWMIRSGDRPSRAREGNTAVGQSKRYGIHKRRYGPYDARDFFDISFTDKEAPIWTFQRMGATHTELPDGRLICVGGEHEDWYDADFYIYNDVVVFSLSDRIEIYGYPKEIFSPTDFHTATLAGDRIILVGCCGYPEYHRPGYTPVYALDLLSYRISKIDTSGEMPGWIYEHTADIDSEGIITIRGGEIIEEHDGNTRNRRNVEEYALDLRSGVWRRLTDRNWRQFTIRQADGEWFSREELLEPEQLLPQRIAYSTLPCEKLNRAKIVIEGVQVSLTILTSEIQIIVEGHLPTELSCRVVKEVCANAEAALQHRCVLEQL